MHTSATKWELLVLRGLNGLWQPSDGQLKCWWPARRHSGESGVALRGGSRQSLTCEVPFRDALNARVDRELQERLQDREFLCKRAEERSRSQRQHSKPYEMSLDR